MANPGPVRWHLSGMFIVTGATGNTGSVVAASLLDAGKPVTLIVRSAAKAEPWKARGAKVVETALTDVAGLTEVFRGASGAYLILPPSPESLDYLADREEIAKAYAEAAKQSGLPHAVLLSSLGAERETGTGPVRALHTAEQLLASMPKLTILRAAYFLDNLLAGLPAARSEGILREFLTPGVELPMIATRDIGAAAAELLLHPPKQSSVIELAGPKDYTPDAIASVLAEVLNRKVTYEALPIEAAPAIFQQFGASEPAAQLFAEMYGAINSGLYRATTNPRRMAISAREFFASHMRHAAGHAAG